MRLRVFILTLIVLSFFTFTQKVFAQDLSNTFSSAYVFSGDLSAQVTFREEFINSSADSVVNRYRIILPYSDAKEVQITVNGSSVPATYKSSESYKEATVDLPDISKGQRVKVVTTFKTSLAAKDFGGMKVITLGSVDPKVTMRGQTLILPGSYGKVSSISADCEISYQATTNITCNTTDKLYLTTGESFFFNFDLKQTLENSLGKNITTNFILPFDGIGQKLYFYESESDVTAKKDKAQNLYLQTNLKNNSKKDINISGIIECGIGYEFASNKSLTEETDIWNFSSGEISKIYDSLGTEIKAQSIYAYMIANYKPLSAEEFTRQKVSKLSTKQELTNIEYTDLTVALLRKAGIKSFAALGDNNGELVTGKEKEFSSWVYYFDPDENSWKGMDPYFADKGQFGDRLFLNPDRIVYFVIDGFEDQKLLSVFISEQSPYINIYSYILDEKFLAVPLNFSVKIVAPDKVSLNADAEISLSLTNDSSRLIHFAKIYKDDDEIKVNGKGADIWVMPSQSYTYDLDGIVLTGLFKTVSADLKLNYSAASVSESKEGSVSSQISAVPTFKTFLPYIFALVVIAALASGYFLFQSIQKRLKKAKN